MSVQPKNQKLDGTPDKDAISALPPKPLTPEQQEKVKGGLTSSAERNRDGLEGN